MKFIRDSLLPIIINAGIILILLSPLTYGNVEIWSVSLFEILAFITFGLWVTSNLLDGRIRLLRSPLYIPFILFFILILFQTISLPVPILKLLSPHTIIIWNIKSEELKHIFGTGIKLSPTISLYPFVTWQKFLLYVSYAMFFIVSANYIRSSKQIVRFFWVIFTIAIIESLIGLLQYILSGTSVPASGTYINPNHFAGLLVLVIPIFLSYILYIEAGRVTTGNWKDKIILQFSTNPILIFSTSLMVISLILSKSRGATISFIITLIFLYALVTVFKKSKSIKFLFAFFFIAIVIFSMWIGLDPVIEKFAETAEEIPKRTYIWKDSINIITDFPLLGVGLGNFSLAYTMYKKAAFWPYRYEHAHNDYLELATETGFLGLILVLWAIISFYKSAIVVLNNFSYRSDPLRFFLILGCLSGMLGMLVNVVTEFNFQIPANAYYFTFILALSSSMLDRIQKSDKI